MHDALYKQFASIGRELNDPEHPLSGAILEVFVRVIFLVLIGSAIKHAACDSIFEMFYDTNSQVNLAIATSI